MILDNIHASDHFLPDHFRCGAILPAHQVITLNV